MFFKADKTEVKLSMLLFINCDYLIWSGFELVILSDPASSTNVILDLMTSLFSLINYFCYLLCLFFTFYILMLNILWVFDVSIMLSYFLFNPITPWLYNSRACYLFYTCMNLCCYKYTPLWGSYLTDMLSVHDIPNKSLTYSL